MSKIDGGTTGGVDKVAHTMDEARAVLGERLGHRDFREGQAGVIRAVLAGNDVLAVMPTGAGKSACYQVPAVLLGGLTIVVSPLISLMGDQVRALGAAGIRGAYLNSTLTPRQQEIVLRRALAGRYDLMYVAPERLCDEDFRAFASHANVPLIAVDEAHCVSEWGLDFRPTYQQIASFVSLITPRPTIVALTATATPRVREDIVELLGLADPHIQVGGFDRPNLFLARHEMTPAQRGSWVVSYVRRHRDVSGIIYAMTRRRVNVLCSLLRDAGINAVSYHAGMDAHERAESQRRFVTGEVSVMVATIAFGMGIDKPDVRYVINDGLPLSIDAYYQEIGRAGRDGEPSECHLLWSRGDIRSCHYFIEHGEYPAGISRRERRRLIERHDGLLGAMIGYAMGGVCLRHVILTYFGEDPDSVPKRCDNCSVCRDELLGGTGARRTTPTQSVPDLIVGYELPVREGDGDDEALFRRLWKLRGRLAETNGIPQGAVFSDGALRDMVSRHPQTSEDLLACAGVSQGKLDRYGDAFLRELQDPDGSRAEIVSANEVSNVPQFMRLGEEPD